MGMGSYDESEQERFEDVTEVSDEDVEQVSTDSYEGDVSYDTPDSADVLMDNFKQQKDG